MRGDFEAYLNDSFRGENGKLDLAALLALEDEADMDVVVVMPTPQPLPQNAELAEGDPWKPTYARLCTCTSNRTGTC